MTEDEDVVFDGDDVDWEPVNSDYNDLKFVKPGKDEPEDGEVTLDEGDHIQGTFKGITELGGVPNYKVVNDDSETDYMFSVQMVLEAELEDVAEGDLIRVRYDGEKENEDGTRTYFDWTVLKPSQ